MQDMLERVFGAPVAVDDGAIVIGGRRCRVVDDVIVLTDGPESDSRKEDVSSTFGHEWQAFSDRKPEHDGEFAQYFDLIDLSSLDGAICADFGCGMGRWSQILLERARPEYLVVIDFSDAIFVARENLRGRENVIFLKADIESVSLADGVFDFSFCLGVLHHIPQGIEKGAANIARCSKDALFYLYYDFEDRGIAFRSVFRVAHGVRLVLSSLRYEPARRMLSHLLTLFAYYPFLTVARIAELCGGNSAKVPLSYYVGYSYERIRQDAYDRFFTPVEYRFNKDQIAAIFQPLFNDVAISPGPPFWHFHCRGSRIGDAAPGLETSRRAAADAG